MNSHQRSRTLRLFHFVRRHVPVAVVAISAGLAAPAHADDISWNTGSGLWSTAANWLPNDVPDSKDIALIGNFIFVKNEFVTLDQDVTVLGLEITDGMSLNLDGKHFSVFGDTLISGWNNPPDPFIYFSSVRVYDGDGSSPDFTSGRLTTTDGGTLRLETGSLVRIHAYLDNQEDGIIRGEGLLQLFGTGFRTFNNDGMLDPTIGGMIIQQLGDARIDLDGVNEAGRVSLSNIESDGSAADKLLIIGSGLTDAFSSEMAIISQGFLHMVLAEGWTADQNSVIRFYGSSASALPSRILGSAVTLAGEVIVSGQTADARIEADAVVQPTAAISVGPSDTLTFTEAVEINGGNFAVDEFGHLEFAGPTTVHGGTFAAQSQGWIDFDGDTDWRGDVTINGLALQNGTATVTQATTITADTFDLDGVAGSTHWNVEHHLVLNVDRIDTAPLDRFDGTLDIGGGFFSLLEVHLTDPSARWGLRGDVNLAGNVLGHLTRIAGNGVDVSGELTVSSKVNINAEMDFLANSSISFASASAELRLNRPSSIDTDVDLLGEGTLICGPEGALTIEEGALLADTHLRNLADLTVATGPAFLLVDTFETAADGSVTFDITDTNGLDAARLATLGTATLAGTLQVRFPEGLPSIPDDTQFTLLAGSPRDGEFDDVDLPYGYRWNLEYVRDDVILTAIERTGDMNCDGVVDALDIEPFLLALFDPNGYARAYPNCDINQGDVNDDGVVNALDIEAFLEVLFGN